MCIEQKTQKELLHYSGIGFIIFALVIIIIGIIFKVFITHQEFGLSDYDAKEYLGGIFLLYGLVFLIVGILSVYAGNEDRWYFYGAYICCATQLFIIVSIFSISVLSLVSMSQQYTADPMICRKVEFMRQSHRLYRKSAETLCTDQCPCLIKDTSMYPQDQLDLFTYTNIDNDPINIMGCSQFDEFERRLQITENNNITEFITSLEVCPNPPPLYLQVTFQCSGICEKYDFYVFSDLNRGPPVSQNSCFDDVNYFIQTYGNILSFILWILCFLLFFSLMSACCLCFFQDNDEDDDRNNRYRNNQLQRINNRSNRNAYQSIPESQENRVPENNQQQQQPQQIQQTNRSYYVDSNNNNEVVFIQSAQNQNIQNPQNQVVQSQNEIQDQQNEETQSK